MTMMFRNIRTIVFRICCRIILFLISIEAQHFLGSVQDALEKLDQGDEPAVKTTDRILTVSSENNLAAEPAPQFDNYSPDDHQARLMQDLLSPQKYDKRIRPSRHFRAPVFVYLKMSMYQLLTVDGVSQEIVCSVWMQESWTDRFLFWNPADYGGIDEMRFPHDDVWQPDTYLYNNRQMEQDQSERKMNVVVRPDLKTKMAHVEMRYPAILSASCIMDVKYFPFDSQHCRFEFGSWTYDNKQIDYFASQDNATLKYLIKSQEWTIIAVYSERMVKKYDCCTIPYTTIVFHIVVQRKSLFYIINLIIPSAIVSIINFIGFFTPSTCSGERNEKINLGLTTLLAMGVLLLQLNDSLPHSSQAIPLLGIYILESILLVGAGTVMAVVVTHLHLRGSLGMKPTRRLRLFLKWYSFIMGNGCCKNFKAKKRTSSLSSFANIDDAESSVMDISELTNATHHTTNTLERLILAHYINNPPIGGGPNVPNGGGVVNVRSPGVPTEADKARSTLEDAVISELFRLRMLIDRLSKDEPSQEDNEWICAAAAVERLCLIVFLTALLVITVQCLGVGFSQMKVPEDALSRN